MSQDTPHDVIPESMRSADAIQPRSVLWAITLTGIALSLFQLYTAGIEPLGLFYQRPAHLAFILFLAFLLFPLTGQNRRRTWWAWVVDGVFLAASFASGFYIIWFLDDIIARAGWWSQADIIVGIVCTVAVLEASRRAVGLGLTIIGLIAILYALAGARGALPGLGEWMPGLMSHRGASVDRLVGQLYLGQEGIFGLPLGVAATYVFMFVLFGAFLEKTGAGKFFIDLAFAATGRKPGGPAKAAVIASAGMGSISGSAIANVVTTGAFTIPLMKKLGYRPAQAGGVEAAASTGGQITPPLMGAGAFLISEYTRIPYIEIVLVSIFPAILYLGTVYLFVHIVAMKQGMRGLPASELPVVRQVLAAGWQFILPLVLLIFLLVNNISPMRVGFWAIISVIAMAGLRGLWSLYIVGLGGDIRAFRVSVWHLIVPLIVMIVLLINNVSPLWGGFSAFISLLAIEALRGAWALYSSGQGAAIRDSVGRGLRMIFDSLELGARNAVAVSIACAVAGIIVGVVGLTGLGLKFSSMMVSLSGGNIVIALILVLIASLILGLGLPVTASYIVLIVLVGPALHNEFGIPLLIAHLVVFWYSQDSNVTPPVALAGFAGAAIAGAKPMETSVQAWKFAKGLYLIPAFMVFNPELIYGGPLPHVLWTGFTAILGLVAFAAAIEGYLFGPMKAAVRLVMVPAVIALFWPSFTAELVGAAVLVVALTINWLNARQARQEQGQPVPAPETVRTHPD